MSDEKPPLIEYPTTYAFKVMGKQTPDFTEYVRGLFSKLTGAEVPTSAIEPVPSSKGTYLSLTVSVRLNSEEQRRSIYLQLHEEERIVYYL